MVNGQSGEKLFVNITGAIITLLPLLQILQHHQKLGSGFLVAEYSAQDASRLEEELLKLAAAYLGENFKEELKSIVTDITANRMKLMQKH